MGPGLSVVRDGDGRTASSLWSSIKASPSKALGLILLACIVTMEASAFIDSDDWSWRVYDLGRYALVAYLCNFLPTRWLRICATTLFITQGLDEITGGNLFQDGIWEYPVFLVFCIVVHKLIK